MPYMQGLVDAVNTAGQLDNVALRGIEEWDELFGGAPVERKIVDVVERVFAYPCDQGLRNYLEAWPPAITQGVMAAVHDALRNQQRVQVLWAPGYDFEARMWQAPPGDTPGGLIIEFRGPYPADVAAQRTSSA